MCEKLKIKLTEQAYRSVYQIKMIKTAHISIARYNSKSVALINSLYLLMHAAL